MTAAIPAPPDEETELRSLAMTEDAELLRAWHDGDRDAGTELVERHYDAVVRFFRTKAGGHAEDLVQRTFLILSEAKDRFRGQGSFRAFLFGIARNVLHEFIRAHVRGGRVVDVNASSIADLGLGVASLVALRADQKLLVACLHQLPVDMQTTLELHYWEGLSVAELAELTGVAEGTVKSRLFRARELLREAMEHVPDAAERRKLRAAWSAVLDAKPSAPRA